MSQQPIPPLDPMGDLKSKLIFAVVAAAVVIGLKFGLGW